MRQNLFVFHSLLVLGVILFAPFFISCGTLSSDTVKLSNAITIRVKDIERSHIHAVNAVFDSQIQRVDKFMDEKWIPLFLRNLVGVSRILEDLEKVDSIGIKTLEYIKNASESYLDDKDESGALAKKIVDALNSKRGNETETIRSIVKDFVPDEKVESAVIHISALLNTETPAVLIMDFAKDANTQINQQRQSLIAPIEEARQLTLAQINQEYVDIYAGQGVITARLEAAVRKDKAQVQLIDAVGGEGTAKKLKSNLLKFADKMEGVLSGIDKIQTKLESSKDALEGEHPDLIQLLQDEIRNALVDSGLLNSERGQAD